MGCSWVGTKKNGESKPLGIMGKSLVLVRIMKKVLKELMKRR